MRGQLHELVCSLANQSAVTVRRNVSWDNGEQMPLYVARGATWDSRAIAYHDDVLVVDLGAVLVLDAMS
jgi:hypothetical protein